MNTVHVSGLWNLYDCQAQLSTVTHVCHHKKVPSFLHVFVSIKMNQTVVEHVVYWLDSMISSTHSDKHNKWQAYSTCWPLSFSMGAGVVPCNSITCEQVIICLGCNRFLTSQKELDPWICFVGYSPYFPDWSQISDLQRAIASKAAETVAEIDDEDTVYGMLCTGGLVHKHLT